MGNYIVTGVSSGIGLAIAKRLTSDGHFVFGISRSKNDKEKIGEQCICDLSSSMDIRRAIREVGVLCGTNNCGIDGIVLNAGIAFKQKLEDVTMVERQIRINALGHYELFMMLWNNGLMGSVCNVVNIISKTAFEANPEQLGYCASKAVHYMLFSGLAKELGKEGVYINHLIPGPVNTKMNPIMDAEKEKEFIDPRKDPNDVVPSVLYLLFQPPTGPIDRILDLRRR